MEEVDTGDVDGFSQGVIDVGGLELVVAIADTWSLRRRGLMGVEDLGDLDGMLFDMDGVVQAGFTMRNTMIPLHIAFFDDAHALVDLVEMQPCTREPCPTYVPDEPYRHAVEVPLGDFAALDDSATLTIKG